MTPNIPQWCIDAAKEITGAHFDVMNWMLAAQIIAAHAPKNEDAEGDSPAVRMANELRTVCNNMTPAQREAYLQLGYTIINTSDAARGKAS